jgi:hypothetical protein
MAKDWTQKLADRATGSVTGFLGNNEDASTDTGNAASRGGGFAALGLDGKVIPEEQGLEEEDVRLVGAVGSWWSDPIGWRVASALTGRSETFLGGIGRDGDVSVARIDHRGKTIQKVVVGYVPAGDDHCNPAILARMFRTGAPLVAWTAHNRDNKVYIRRAKNRFSLDAWNDIQTIDYGSGRTTSYVMIYEERNVAGRLHLFTRCEATNFDGSYWWSRSTDDGATWSDPVKILDFGPGEHAYMIGQQLNWELAGSNSTVRFAVYGHPDESTLHEIRQFNIRLNTGEVRVGSTTIANIITPSNLPVDATSLPIVYSPPAGKNIRLFDISNRRTPGPEICFAEWTAGQDSAPWDAAYYVLVSDGTTYTKRYICDAGGIIGHRGSAHYHGGMNFPALADGAAGVVYTSRQEGTEWVIEEWKGSGGTTFPTWTMTEEIARSTRKLARPFGLDYHYSDLDGPVGGWKVAWRDYSYYSEADGGFADVLGDTAGS